MEELYSDIIERFKSLRSAHKKETAEDYVELIFDFIKEKGSARMVDIARCMGISQPTATKVVSRLQKEDFIFSRPYQGLILTKKGLALARKSKARHKVVLDFLLALGVSPKVAKIDTEGIEHHVSEETVKLLKEFVKSKNKKAE